MSRHFPAALAIWHGSGARNDFWWCFGWHFRVAIQLQKMPPKRPPNSFFTVYTGVPHYIFQYSFEVLALVFSHRLSECYTEEPASASYFSSSCLSVIAGQTEQQLGGNSITMTSFQATFGAAFWAFFALLNQEQNYTSKNGLKSGLKLEVNVSFSNGTLGQFPGQFWGRFFAQQNPLELLPYCASAVQWFSQQSQKGIRQDCLKCPFQNLLSVAIFSVELPPRASTPPMTIPP